ncbi:glutamate receptor 2.2-like [Bidens hawaiensis]|uniref:glutamate receptor 2.2-like n=1 Tax=Bidens hawaiensis TaxID=980011 RepID=UPI0040498555
MHNVNYLILSLFAFSLPCFLLLQATLATGSLTTCLKAGNEYGVGVILDQTSRPGKEAKVAIELAIQEFNMKANQSLVLYLKNSRNKPVHATLAGKQFTSFTNFENEFYTNINSTTRKYSFSSNVACYWLNLGMHAAKELIDEHKVKAILGAHTWEEASAIAEVIADTKPDHDIPVFLSLAGTIPPQATDQWPFFIQAVPTQSTQMNAVVAILHSIGIGQVTLIYETSSSASTISHFIQVFRQTGSELTHVLPLTSTSSSLDEELEVVKRQQRKVFLIHTSFELGVRLFQTAKKMNMTGDGYLWIATNGITDYFHSVNSSVISSLKGMVGVKSYFPENTWEFSHFKKRFRRMFHSNYPEEEEEEPGVFAMQGYNALKMVVENFHEPKPILGNTVEIVNVNGKGYHSVYWTEGLGFSETVQNEINRETSYTHSIDNIGHVLWPAQPWYATRSRRNLLESSGKKLRVGVPAHSLFNQFVHVYNDDEKNSETVIKGFVVEVFEAMMLKMNLLRDRDYDLIPFYDRSYDALMRAIDSEVRYFFFLLVDMNEHGFDAVAGDVTILEERYEFANFTQPYTESGLEMIVPVKPSISNESWLFLKPFSTTMWLITASITIYNGFVIWLIERNHNKDLQGTIITQIVIVIWLAFSTLFTLRGDKMHSNLSRMSVVVWLFVALVITESYTASLTSMLTAQRLEPTITSVEMLRNRNAIVGYCNGSFVDRYLQNVLGFTNITTQSYNSTHEYAEALNSRKIEAIFLEVPAAKVFLAQYCKSFKRTGETFKVGGFGFAFSRSFEHLSNANKALMNVAESKKLKELEDKYFISEECVDEESSPDKAGKLNFHSFWVLFLLTGGTSTVALVIYIIISIKELKNQN